MPPRNKRIVSGADARMWAVYVRDVRPLPGHSMPPVVEPEPIALAVAPPMLVVTPVDRVACQTAPVPPNLVVDAAPPGLDRATWTRFRSGKRDVERHLDLHGHTVQRAYDSVRQFLAAAQSDGVRCVEIVTGRGRGEAGGVLRRELPLWLQDGVLGGMVIALIASNPGAFRLLLRRQRR